MVRTVIGKTDMRHKHHFALKSRPQRAADHVPPLRAITIALASLAIAACSSLGASGPSGSDIRKAGSQSYAESGIQVIDLDSSALARVLSYGRSNSFAEIFGDGRATDTLIGNGDIVDITIWEAPPAVLFGATTSNSGLEASLSVAQSATIPQQMVGADGTISVPFAGNIAAAGRTTSQIERDILRRLSGKAHDPQAIVRLAQNEARNVTIIGEVANSRRMPLTAKGERLLDALASAGGPTEPVGKTTVQIARDGNVVIMPLEQVVRDPVQNIRLLPDDVVTILYQPYSFTALGAVVRSAEIPFEGSGLSLAEALGRMGGLRDDRADIRGVFIFRMEETAALDPVTAATARTTAAGRVPVIYRVDLSDPASIFAIRDFYIEDDDIVYVSTAPGADLQRFISTLSGAAFSIVGISDAVGGSNN